MFMFHASSAKGKWWQARCCTPSNSSTCTTAKSMFAIYSYWRNNAVLWAIILWLKIAAQIKSKGSHGIMAVEPGKVSGSCCLRHEMEIKTQPSPSTPAFSDKWSTISVGGKEEISGYRLGGPWNSNLLLSSQGHWPWGYLPLM